ncbi:MAG: hypothetical protein ABI651_07250, partial [Verrucomicrobiota bacterium]
FSACKKSSSDEEAAAPDQPGTRDLAGSWAGKLAIGKVELRLVLKVAKSTDGSYTATIDSPDQGAKDIPVTSILYNDPALQLELEGLAAAYRGSLNKAATEISGNWEQGGRTLPLAFRRTRAAAASATPTEESFAFTKGSKPDIRGYWKGELDVQGIKLRLALKIARAADGTYSGTMDSLDQGARDLPITTIAFKSPTVKLDWKLLNASFGGKLNKDATQMSGNWTQGPRSFPLVFERTDQPPTAMPSQEQLSFDTPPGGSPDIRGYWQGKLEIDPVSLRLLLKIGKAPDGSYAGTLDSPDQGSKDLPMTSITFTSPSVRLEWKAIGGSFQGDLNQEGTQMSGNFSQLGRNNPMTFDRVAQPAGK